MLTTKVNNNVQSQELNIMLLVMFKYLFRLFASVNIATKVTMSLV